MIRTTLENLDLSQYLRSGDHVVFGQACGEPTALVEALVAQGAGIGGLYAFIATSFSGLFTPGTASAFRLSSMGAIGALRAMTKANALDVVPVHVSQVAPLITAGVLPCDVAMIQVSPADSAEQVPGRLTQVRFVGGASQRLVVPASALLRRGELTAVYVAAPRGEGQTGFALRAVRTGASHGEAGVEVLAGLKAGDQVALDPVRAGLAGARPAAQ